MTEKRKREKDDIDSKYIPGTVPSKGQRNKSTRGKEKFGFPFIIQQQPVIPVRS